MSSIGGVGGLRPPQHHKPPSFDQIDSNSDGGISLDEFESAAPKNADKSKTDALFKTMDSDGEGSVSKSEMNAFKDKAQKADSMLQSFLFSLQSRDSSSTQQASTGDSSDIFSQIDTDSSGGISKDEFTKAFGDSKLGQNGDKLNQLFGAIDKDGDGSISQNEVKQFQTSMQEHHGHHGHHGPPPAPPADVTNATQAYGSASTLTSTASNTNTAYAQSA